MLSEIIDYVSDTKKSYSQTFVQAKEYWEKFFNTHQTESDNELSQSLGDTLSSFTSIFGNDYLFAKKIMVLTAISYLESEKNFYENPDQKKLAIKVLKAFKNSKISEEVKDQINNVAKEYEIKI